MHEIGVIENIDKCMATTKKIWNYTINNYYLNLKMSGRDFKVKNSMSLVVAVQCWQTLLEFVDWCATFFIWHVGVDVLGVNFFNDHA